MRMTPAVLVGSGSEWRRKRTSQERNKRQAAVAEAQGVFTDNEGEVRIHNCLAALNISCMCLNVRS